MRLRYGTISDAEELARIEAASYPAAEGASLESIKQRLETFAECFWILDDGDEASVGNGAGAGDESYAEIGESGDVLVDGKTAENSARIIAFINGMACDDVDLRDEMYDDAGLHKKDGKWQMLFSVVTDPDYRGHGYASTVMKRVIEDSRNRGRLGIVLTCKEKLLKFYGSFGFINEGISSSTHGDVSWYQMRLVF